VALSPATGSSGLCASCLLATVLVEEDDPADTLLEPGTLVGPFRIVELLGRGGMAAVYQADDLRLDRAVALKILPPALLHDGGFARRFAQEARVVARLEHAHVVPIYATGIDEGIPWMSMRLLVGGNLGAAIARRRPTVAEAVQILRDSASALDYAHSRGVVHRDIKPTNLLVDAEGRVSVGDFGLARIHDDRQPSTRAGFFAGTPEYMSPEQASGAAIDFRCDIYSLGIVAYELFAGQPPFTASTPMAVLLKQIHDDLPELPGAVASGIMIAIRKAAAKEPAQRWASASAFVDALAEAASGGQAGSASAAGGTNAPRRLRTAAALVALTLAAAGAWRFTRPGSPPPADSAITAAPPPRLEQQTGAGVPIASAIAQAPGRTAGAAAPPMPIAPSATASPAPVVGRAFSLSPVFAVPASDGIHRELAVGEAEDAAPRREPPPAASLEAPPAPRLDTAPAVVRPAVRLRTVDADYPNAARAAQIEGDVLLQVMVDVEGKVSGVTVVKSVHPLLDAAARKAVLQYRYAPATRNGDPEASTIRIAVSFRLR
jgi:serine/threonine-protein kinase